MSRHKEKFYNFCSFFCNFKMCRHDIFFRFIQLHPRFIGCFRKINYNINNRRGLIAWPVEGLKIWRCVSTSEDIICPPDCNRVNVISVKYWGYKYCQNYVGPDYHNNFFASQSFKNNVLQMLLFYHLITFFLPVKSILSHKIF